MRALVLTVSHEDVELASDALWGLGVGAVEERELDEDRVELRTTVGDDDQSFVMAARSFPQWGWRTEHVESTPVETWREFAEPVVVADSVMTIPAWMEGIDVGEGRVGVRIEPGGSFGLGDHPTTRLALEHVVSAVGSRPGCRLLDVGCGSGVLAIAAVLLGAREARGLDVSSAAVEAARANVERNGVSRRVRIDDTRAGELDEVYDVVVANILAPVLVGLADDLRRLCAPGGLIVLSGILDDRHDHVLAALEPAEPIRSSVLDGWAGITLRR